MLKEFTKGLVKENPVIILMLGLCPALACTTTAYDGLGMGIALTFVLTSSNVFISLLKKVIQREFRIPFFVIVISTFVTICDYIMKAYFPRLSETLGVFVPLIVVNCIVLARVEAVAYKAGVLHSFLDGLGMGIGFALVLLITGIVREIFGNGTIFGYSTFISENPCIFMILPPGAFFTFGMLATLAKGLMRK